ncbi:hypothetical protein KB559_19025 [Paenibacillus sp. Marseille-P2973]|uniref:hypothetical protein n=1 Tax=Paenibacillus sp. Marseille-P2973 TaxID=1871032 RepID=UPI001B375AB4|nr:hypothetical protein [Paenibacillus sp. Marseille-P2973]MBQ4900935.1 hypothetical protein [Paenibacillus sp. Marseille-P2973]
MKLFLKVKDKNCLPEADELVAIMWKRGVNISRVGRQDSLIIGTSLTLSWDKWLDDERWRGHPKCKEYLYFEIETINNEQQLSIEIDEDACFVDFRAMYKAVEFIAERCNTLISIDKGIWVQIKEYRLKVDNYIKINFQEAVEKSLHD